MKLLAAFLNGLTTTRGSRRKNLVVIAFLLLAALAVVRINEMGRASEWVVLRPMFNSESEARRLLAFVNHVGYDCREMLPGVWNVSMWPICLDTASSEQHASRKHVVYSIGEWSDYFLESILAHNYSYAVNLISRAPPIVRWPNTTTRKLNIVPNDPADFARNFYDQRTMNDLWGGGEKSRIGEGRVDLLRISAGMSPGVEAWELLLLMIKDNLLDRVNNLQVEIVINRLEDTYLFNWYRTLHALFTRSHLALYNTWSSDSRCLRVTLMESCVLMLSFARVALGSRVHGTDSNKIWTQGIMGTRYVLQPPADFGSKTEEASRLREYLSSMQTDCEISTVGGSGDTGGQGISSGDNIQPSQEPSQWIICPKRLHQSCNVVRLRLSDERQLEKDLIEKYDCTVATFVIQSRNSSSVSSKSGKIKKSNRNSIDTFKMYKRFTNQKGRGDSGIVSWEQVLEIMRNLGSISVLEINAPLYEWTILSMLMDNRALENVTQLVASIHCSADLQQDYHTVSRSHILLHHYSELKRIESFGLSLFSATPIQSSLRHAHYRLQPVPPPNEALLSTDSDLNYNVSFVRTRYL